MLLNYLYEYSLSMIIHFYYHSIINIIYNIISQVECFIITLGLSTIHMDEFRKT